MSAVSRMPMKTVPRTNAKSGWFYENARSIDVYIETDEGFVCACRIPRRHLADWIKRTEPK